MAAMSADRVFVDTNVLLAATTPSRGLHRRALTVLNDWPNLGWRLCASGQILREYLVVATRPADVNGLGLAVPNALENVSAFRTRMRWLNERQPVARRLLSLVAETDCRGKQIHDANIVATALEHGVDRLVTANANDFRRFKGRIAVLDLAAPPS